MKIDVTAIILQIINFSIVAGGLTYLLLNPVRRILEERSNRVAEAQKAADQALSHEAELAKLKEKAQREARSESKKLMDEAKAEVSQRKSELLKEAKAEAKAETEKLMKNFEREQQGKLDAMQSEFKKAVLAVSSAVIGSDLDEKKHAKLIEQGLKEIAQAQ